MPRRRYRFLYLPIAAKFFFSSFLPYQSAGVPRVVSTLSNVLS
jgi:hypothetical protein